MLIKQHRISHKIPSSSFTINELNHLLHMENIYDVILWLIYFPLLLFYLYKYQSHLPDIIKSSNMLPQILTGLTIFFILLLAFRLVFNLGRWLFPYMQIKNQITRERYILKAIYSLFITTVLGEIVLRFSSFFWDALIK